MCTTKAIYVIIKLKLCQKQQFHREKQHIGERLTQGTISEQRDHQYTPAHLGDLEAYFKNRGVGSKLANRAFQSGRMRN